MENPKTPNIAVVGSGYWGKNLVRNYYQLGALKLICDENKTLLTQFREQYPKVETCLAFSEVLAQKEIDAVAIATPTETHYALAREALLAGKHIYVEKPLVLNENEAADLIQLASEKSRILMVGHLLQYHPAFVCLRELASKGDLGRIDYIYSHRLNLGKIRREENILWSFAPHDISMILSIAGENPESLVCTGGNYLHKKIADVTTTHLEFPSGLRAHIFVSWLHPFKEQKLVVVGDQKMAVFDDTRPWVDKLLFYPHKIKWQNNVPIPTTAEPERVEILPAEPLRLECQQFLDSISNGTPILTDGHEGLRGLNVLIASQRSLDHYGKRIYLNHKFALTADGESGNLKIEEPTAVIEDGFIHPTAIVDDMCDIGAKTKIWHFSHILTGSSIGENCNIGQNVVIGPEVIVGTGCKIQNNVSIYKGITLEEEVFCGPSTVFTNVNNPRAGIRKMDQLRPTLVRKGATLGANCTIICGVVIGSYAFIGAGAVITRDVLNHAVTVGNPARQIGWVCECGERLDENLICTVCGKTFKKEAEGLIRNVQPDIE